MADENQPNQIGDIIALVKELRAAGVRRFRWQGLTISFASEERSAAKSPRESVALELEELRAIPEKSPVDTLEDLVRDKRAALLWSTDS